MKNCFCCYEPCKGTMKKYTNFVLSMKRENDILCQNNKNLKKEKRKATNIVETIIRIPNTKYMYSK